MAIKNVQAGRAKTPLGARGSSGTKAGKPAPSQAPHANVRPGASWKLEDAKAKFSEVVRRAQAEGPQYVTVRGKPSVAVIDAADLERLLPARKPRMPLVAFLESLYAEGLDLTRDTDTGRDVNL
jgi:antitoxin Phd